MKKRVKLLINTAQHYHCFFKSHKLTDSKYVRLKELILEWLGGDLSITFRPEGRYSHAGTLKIEKKHKLEQILELAKAEYRLRGNIRSYCFFFGKDDKNENE